MRTSERAQGRGTDRLGAQVDYFDLREVGMGRVGPGGMIGIIEMFPDFFPGGLPFRVRTARARTRCELLELRQAPPARFCLRVLCSPAVQFFLLVLLWHSCFYPALAPVGPAAPVVPNRVLDRPVRQRSSRPGPCAEPRSLPPSIRPSIHSSHPPSPLTLPPISETPFPLHFSFRASPMSETNLRRSDRNCI